MAEDRRTDEEKAWAVAANAEYLRVSYSSLNTESSCSRRFEFSKLYPQRDRAFDSYAADVGIALHKGYQEYLTSNDETKSFWAFAKSFPYGLEYAESNDFRSLEAATSTLEEMIDSSELGEYELAQIRHPTGEIVPAIEVPFELRLKGITLPDDRGIAFVGFIDAILRKLTTDVYRTIDIKTHRRATKDATGNYLFNAQQIPYGIALEHIQGRPVDSFEVMYYDCFVDLLHPVVSAYTYIKDSDDVQEWLMNTVLQAQRIQRHMELDYFPRCSGGCVSWNRNCGYLDVCQSRDRETIQDWLLLGEEPAVPRYEVPWILAEIDVFGSEA